MPEIQGATSPVLEAVCFDMDGLLVETESLWLRAETELMAAMGVTWTTEDQAHCLGGPLSRVGQYMVGLAGGGDPETVVRDLVERVEGFFHTEPLHWMPGARELLSELRTRKVPRALVSASPQRLVDAVLSNVVADLGSDAFVTTVSSNDTLLTKPHPDPYLEGCRRLNTHPARTVVLEDSPTGATAGVAAGCMVVGVPHLSPITAAPRLVTVSSLAEVRIEWLEELLLTR